MGGKPVQVRVTQGKEPAHFRQLFKGNMIVFKGTCHCVYALYALFDLYLFIPFWYSRLIFNSTSVQTALFCCLRQFLNVPSFLSIGGNASGFSNSSSAAVEQADTALFHIKGTTALNTVAVEVTGRADSLNSDDSFVLVTSSHVSVLVVFSLEYECFFALVIRGLLTKLIVSRVCFIRLNRCRALNFYLISFFFFSHTLRFTPGRVAVPTPMNSPWRPTLPPPLLAPTRVRGLSVCDSSILRCV